MKYSKTGILLTEKSEGFQAEAYPDPAGQTQNWSIGFGHHGLDVHEGMTCTRSQAEKWLYQDVQAAENFIERYVKIPLTQGEFDALVDFIYNLGIHNFLGSTLLKLLNRGKIQQAAKEFEKWDHCGGKEVAGLLARRKEEEAEFLGKPYAA